MELVKFDKRDDAALKLTLLDPMKCIIMPFPLFYFSRHLGQDNPNILLGIDGTGRDNDINSGTFISPVIRSVLRASVTQ